MHVVNFTIEIHYDARPYERLLSIICTTIGLCILKET